jgi:hypothetical protein
VNLCGLKRFLKIKEKKEESKQTWICFIKWEWKCR